MSEMSEWDVVSIASNISASGGGEAAAAPIAGAADDTVSTTTVGVDLSSLPDTGSELSEFDLLSELDVQSVDTFHEPTFWDNDGQGNELDALDAAETEDDAVSVSSLCTQRGWPRPRTTGGAAAGGAAAGGGPPQPQPGSPYLAALMSGGGGVEGQRARQLSSRPTRVRRNMVRPRRRTIEDELDEEARARSRKTKAGDEERTAMQQLQQEEDDAALNREFEFRKFIVPNSVRMKRLRVKFRGPFLAPPRLPASHLSSIAENDYDSAGGGEEEEEEEMAW